MYTYLYTNCDNNMFLDSMILGIVFYGRRSDYHSRRRQCKYSSRYSLAVLVYGITRKFVCRNQSDCINHE